MVLIRGEDWLLFGAHLNRVYIDHVDSALGAGGGAIEGPMIELQGCVNKIWQHQGCGMGAAKVA